LTTSTTTKITTDAEMSVTRKSIGEMRMSGSFRWISFDNLVTQDVGLMARLRPHQEFVRGRDGLRRFSAAEP
jgi:hypothetical protein